MDTEVPDDASRDVLARTSRFVHTAVLPHEIVDTGAIPVGSRAQATQEVLSAKSPNSPATGMCS